MATTATSKASNTKAKKKTGTKKANGCPPGSKMVGGKCVKQGEAYGPKTVKKTTGTKTASKDYIGDKSKPNTPRPKGGPSGAISKRRKRGGLKIG